MESKRIKDPGIVPVNVEHCVWRYRTAYGSYATAMLQVIRLICIKYLVGDVAQQFYVLQKNNHNHMENASIPIRALYGIRGVSALLPYR